MTLNVPSVDHRPKATQMQTFGQRISKACIIILFLLTTDREEDQCINIITRSFDQNLHATSGKIPFFLKLLNVGILSPSVSNSAAKHNTNINI